MASVFVALIALVACGVLATLLAVRIFHKTRRSSLAVMTVLRVLAMNVVVAWFLLFVTFVADQLGARAWNATKFVFNLGPDGEAPGDDELLRPLASLHFWLVAWDAWRWQRRKIAEHEARQRAESETRTPS